MSCNLLSIFLSLNIKATLTSCSQKNVCLTNFSTFPGTSTALAVAPDDWFEKQQSAIIQSICSPDQRTFQQHMEEGANTSGSQNAKKLGKRNISESNAEHGTCMYMCIFFYCSGINVECTEGKKNPCPH